jgi:RNA polymerase sigma-70 factor (ECF subfamily)
MREMVLDREGVASGAVAPAPTVEDEFGSYRAELIRYCYRMLGSSFEAEDAVQETLVRAWRSADRFEGRSSARSWLYRIATNVCIDMHRQPQRRARPMDLGPASPPDESRLGPPLTESAFVTALPDTLAFDDPAEAAEQRESIRLAFVAALQHLPARQRAALILCEVLRWKAAEAAELLDMSVPALNSALQRARATLASLPPEAPLQPLEASDAELLRNYVEAFERYDIDRFVSLLRKDAVQSMPPFSLWMRGSEAIGTWMVQPGPSGCRGSQLLPTAANGLPAFAQYRPDPDGGWYPWGIHLLEVRDGQVAVITNFLALLEPDRLFAHFGLPTHLDAQAA